MSKTNRDELFIEVNQKDLIDNIFNPIKNLINNNVEGEAHFFGKRFAILGDFKIGKTELGKCMNYNLNKIYNKIIILTINSKMVQYLGIKEIDNWLYEQWLIHLTQIKETSFNDIVKEEIKKFHDDRGYHPLDKSFGNYLDKIYLITNIYREYLKIEPNARFVVEFDQANVIAEEAQFTPFYEFWRNFQGYWEDDNYFSELPIFLFVIGHKDWENFATLKNSIGRGVFDKWIVYNYWNAVDIHQLIKKRLEYAIKPKHKKELLKFFLCPGIIDFFGKKLGEASTQEYLDSFFGEFLKNFLKNYEYNRQKFKDFLDFCTKDVRKKKYEETYFDDIERIFSGTPALDYMPVFLYFREIKEKKWFDEIFKLIEELYDKTSIPFDSKGLKDYKNLTHRFIYENFSLSALSDMKPIHNPPLFHDYKGNLALDSAFKRCLEAIPRDKRSPVYRLKRFVKSERIEHELFYEKKDGKEMSLLLKTAQKLSNDIVSLIQEWFVNEYLGIINNDLKLNSNNLIPFDIIRKKIFKLNDLYKGSTTNWALFDKEGRDIPDLLMGKYFPKQCCLIDYINLENLKKIKMRIISPKVSNISMIRLIVEILTYYNNKIKDFDNQLKKEHPKADTYREIIQKGETLTTEFKSSLCYDYYQKKVNKELEFVIVKTIAGFMNTEGGKLFIGVNDNGKILSLANDYLSLKKKNKDGLKLRIIDIISTFIGKEYNSQKYYKILFKKLDNIEICIIEVLKSKKPIYIKMKNNNEEFYIRTEASTMKLNTREAHDYIKEHWKN